MMTTGKKMEIHFSGTGASEGIPNPYCSCQICEQARFAGGKEKRTRASVIIDKVLQIDLSPEYAYQLMRDQFNAREINGLLFTHTHPDHFNIGELYSRMAGFAHDIHHPLHIYGSDIAISECAKLLAGYSKDRFRLHSVIPFVTFEFENYCITPLLANHAAWEFCYLWFIEKEGKTLFYGHDSGWFPELTWQWLEKKRIDLAILECTTGYNGDARSDNHMSIETIIAACKRLRASGCLKKESRISLSHISHNIKMGHFELTELMFSYGADVAWDGLTLNI